MKSQGTIRPEVRLSLTFMSIGDDIQEIYMGSGMIINEKEKEPFKGFAWGEWSPGLCSRAKTPWPCGSLFRGWR